MEEKRVASENKRGVILTVNDKKYRVWISHNSISKVKYQDDGMNTILRTNIYNITDNRMMSWKEINGSYLAEKVSDYIENSFNGQWSIYWNNNLEGVKE